MKINRIVDELTIEEKTVLVSGADKWHTAAVPRLNIPSIMVADGPHGLRKELADLESVGVGTGVPATCFPPAATSANSWDPELLVSLGRAIGEEALQEGVSVVLGPGANIKRSPLCGRNFEYFSEDPFLTGELASGWIRGIQSTGVGACLKHFAANNQESWRMVNDSVVDERALREIYLAGFEKAIKQAQPWAVMAAYNKLNGTYCCENLELLTDILRREWGFDGAVISDWGAVNDRVLGLRAGLNLEMPASYGVAAKLIEGDLTTGRLTEAVLNRSVREVIKLVTQAKQFREKEYTYDQKQHHELAQKIARESAVLLKNEKNVLPLKKKQKVAILGRMAENPRYQGAGSSQINPTQLDTVLEKLEEANVEFSYAPGYPAEPDQLNQALVVEAARVAKEADVAVVFVGLPPQYESEGFDRTHLDLPPSHNELVKRIVKENERVVVVLSGGAPVTMPWLEQVQAVLHSYLSGQAGAGAIVELLFGEANPCGKLAETYPLALEDHPGSKFFAYDRDVTEYRESIFVGYRYYDRAEKEVLFPFGYGLSYTQFDYANFTQSAKEIKDNEELTVGCTLKNTGSYAGYEIVQLYIEKPDSKLFRAVRELKGFRKVWLEPGEEKNVEFTLNTRSFAYYNVKERDWHVEPGAYVIKIGPSSRELPLEGRVQIETTRPEVQVPDYREIAPAYYNLGQPTMEFPKVDFLAIYGKKFPEKPTHPEPYHQNSTLQDLQATRIGRLAAKVAKKRLWEMSDFEDESDPTWQMTVAMLMETPLRSIVPLSDGLIPERFVRGLLAWANGHYGQALSQWLRF